MGRPDGRRAGPAGRLRLPVAALVVLALAGCATSPMPSASPPPIPSNLPSNSVGIALQSFAITPSVDSVKAGNVTFLVENQALDIRHEFTVVSTDKDAAALPIVGDSIPEDQIDLLDGSLEPFPAGETKTATFDLKPGHYVFMCNIPGHYLYGMRVNFTVTP
jgi:uncharacterized cupredoxin-like copper-binding protein